MYRRTNLVKFHHIKIWVGTQAAFFGASENESVKMLMVFPTAIELMKIIDED